jgi:hypothetical protein
MDTKQIIEQSLRALARFGTFPWAEHIQMMMKKGFKSEHGEYSFDPWASCATSATSQSWADMFCGKWEADEQGEPLGQPRSSQPPACQESGIRD